MPARHIPRAKWRGRQDPEDGVTAKRFYHFEADGSPNAVIGFRCDAGVRRNQGRTGAKEGPTAIRTALSNLPALSGMQTFTDLGDIEVNGDDLEQGQALLAGHVEQALNSHDKLLVLGGGHETAWASYLGLAKRYPDRQIGIINLDAHLDLRNIAAVGPSSGTPFNQIRNFAPERFDYLCLGVAEEANTTALFERAADWGVNMIDDKSLIKDIHAADAEIEALVERSDMVYLTIDIDLLPHYQAPGVSAPATRGVPLAAVEHLVDHVIETCAVKNCRMPLMDIVEVSPTFDRDNMTAKIAAVLARRFLR